MHDMILEGARTHNLRGVSLRLRPGEFIALTGPSGSGKSSLALDTLYAEGQRRFVESFSPYARQFLERKERPPMQRLDPIAATVAVDRKAPVKSSRSTLATLADLEPYLSALFAKAAVPLCADCGVEAVHTTAASAAATLMEQHPGARVYVSAPITIPDTESFLELRAQLLRDGIRRLLIDTGVRELEEVRPSDVITPGTRVCVVVDRLVTQARDARRLQEAIEGAWARSSGRCVVMLEGKDQPVLVAVGRGLVCPRCAKGFDAPHARLFSYNSPLGACDACRGFGRVIGIDWDKVIPDHGKSLDDGAIKAWTGKSAEWERGALVRFCERKAIPMDVAWERLSAAQRELILQGEGSWSAGKFPGVRAWFKWLEGRTYKMHVRVFLARYREYTACEKCGGARLNALALSYRVAGKHLAQWHALTVAEAQAANAALDPSDAQGKRVQAALAARLGYLQSVGLGYLSLDRQARTLSGGEAQRAGLTTALGAALTGTLFVLDEPTVGLHATDVPQLARVMRELARAGNTVLCIEHDPSVVLGADRVVELGPGSGQHGGTILFDGPPTGLAARKDLPTTKALTAATHEPRTARKPSAWLELTGVNHNNMRGLDVRVPLGVLCAVTGPSGSGKSSLVEDVLYRAVARGLGDAGIERPGEHQALSGMAALRRAVLVDQSPLGRTARGNAATYTKAWDRIRQRFADEALSKASGLEAKHFSFNVDAGRCAACAGEGYETVEMQFLADVSFSCPVCHGKRFKPNVLAVKHAGMSVADLLEASVDEVLARLDSEQAPDLVLRRALDPVRQVGLGYLPLGQPLSTLSGGEAQRLKLARALSEPAAGTLFCIDEPSAGLHAQDVTPVLEALHRLVRDGASVVVVEHDLSVITAADWVIDFGPNAGPEGGQIVAQGTVAEVAASETRTGVALRAKTSKLPRPSKKASAEPAPLPAQIRVEHAREHNLKNVSVAIPHGKLTVVTGPSGSGKSSLAFDVVFAEGQRRFMETLSPYARQFLPTLPRPDVDHVHGVPPAIALEQRTTRGGVSSTVATVTEVAHYLRLLFAKVGTMHCPRCESAVRAQSAESVFVALQKRRGSGTVYAPAVRGRKGTYLDVFNDAARAGVKLARVDGKLLPTDPPPKLAKTKEHSIDLVTYVGPLGKLDRDAFDRALAWGGGAVAVHAGQPSASAPEDEQLLSTTRACPSCGLGMPELDPRWFSFNTKQGQCEACVGTGVEGANVLVDEKKKKDSGGRETVMLDAGLDLDLDHATPCVACKGSRLAPIPRRVQLSGRTYAELVAMPVEDALSEIAGWSFAGDEARIADAPLNELRRRLGFVADVGLHYLALDRPAKTLSGGEMQRLRLSAQLGSGLTGALYVLDEPTIGLHPRDTHRLIGNLRALVDTGSTVLVVEHDAETIAAADHLIDIGPTGGRGGGHIVASGASQEVLADPASPTGRELSQRHDRETRKPAAKAAHWLNLRGARGHNLGAKAQGSVDLRVPVGQLSVVCGVSGSGKSTLIRQVFYPALRRALGLVAPAPLPFTALAGVEHVKRALAVDQSPIGRTPRSVPATFLGIWDDIRKLYASLPEAQVRGFGPQRFSFNTGAGGRCESCDGQGAIVSEMAFLPDVVSVCESCAGLRFEPATLDVKWNGLSIGDVLQLSAADAAQLFATQPRIARPLQTLTELGVGYVQLGQGSNTLSGGEAQRMKLALELTAGAAHEPTVYVLDEPTTGLHIGDVRRLITVMNRLVARGDTLVVIEHQPDVIAAADWVIELGPEAGLGGGQIVYEGSVAGLKKAKTATGRYLAA